MVSGSGQSQPSSGAALMVYVVFWVSEARSWEGDCMTMAARGLSLTPSLLKLPGAGVALRGVSPSVGVNEGRMEAAGCEDNCISCANIGFGAPSDSDGNAGVVRRLRSHSFVLAAGAAQGSRCSKPLKLPAQLLGQRPPKLFPPKLPSLLPPKLLSLERKSGELHPLPHALLRGPPNQTPSRDPGELEAPLNGDIGLLLSAPAANRTGCSLASTSVWVWHESNVWTVGRFAAEESAPRWAGGECECSTGRPSSSGWSSRLVESSARKF